MNKILIILGFWMMAISLRAADVAPPLDASPLEPPAPIAVIRNVEATNLFSRVTSVLKTNDFKIVKRDDREFLVEMRKGAVNASDYERVLFWFTRDVADPATIKVHMRFGKYIKLFGGEQKRVLLDKDKEQRATATWMPSLIEALAVE